MEAEGIESAKRYYDKHGVTFPALVDPHFATGFGFVPWTFFVDEHGVVRGKGGDWKKLIKPAREFKAVTPQVLAQWSDSKNRLTREVMVSLEEKLDQHPGNLSIATELASRYLAPGEKAQGKSILEKAIRNHDARKVATSGEKDQQDLLSRAYLQLSLGETGNRDAQLAAARTAYTEKGIIDFKQFP